MTRSGRQDQALAVVLAAMSGFVDATGFLATGGLFVSFMSGNSTRLAVDLAGPNTAGNGAAAAGAVIGAFLLGVMLGAVVARAAGRWRQPAVLALVCALLAGAALCGGGGWLMASIGLAVFAMGAENATFERDGEVSIGLTYMTGTLVKTGQGIVRALTGGPRWAWLSHALLWCGFVAGAVAGAACFPLSGLPGLGWAAAWAGVLTVVTAAGCLHRGRGGRSVHGHNTGI